ncbi:hypothetical protein MBANPS3_012497 [Mucor bainieri]
MSHTEPIILFKAVRNYKNNLENGALKLIIETTDNLIDNCQLDLNNIAISANTCITIPLTAICKDWEDDENLDYLLRPTAQRSLLMQDFFQYNEDHTALTYKTRQDCKSAQTLSKTRRDHNNNLLQVHKFFGNLLTYKSPEMSFHLKKVEIVNDSASAALNSMMIYLLSIMNILPLGILPLGRKKLIKEYNYGSFHFCFI